MDLATYSHLKSFGHAKANAPLAKLTTLKIGGTAEVLVEVAETEKLVKLLDFLNAEGINYLLVGGGSNLLLPDDTLDGVVIRVKTGVVSLKSNLITADAGVSFSSLTHEAVKSSLSGLEWSAGLPGTVGGAVRGNAGANGGETAYVLNEIEAWQDGERIILKPEECEFAYRDSIFKRNPLVVLRASFKLVPGDQKKSMTKMQEILAKRRTYPGYPSAGCFFKNIWLENWPGDKELLPKEFIKNKKIPASYLIDECGLKGKRVGGAMISNEHGNFLINAGGATQADVLSLVEVIKTNVYNKYGVELVEEVQIVR